MWDFTQVLLRIPQPVDGAFHLTGVAGELLAQADRGGIHQVRAAGLDDRVEGFGLLCESLLEDLQRRLERVRELCQRREVNRRRDYIVTGLAEIHVIVRMHEFAAPCSPEQFDRPIRNDLIGVRVRGRARSGLKDVQDELVVPAAVGNFGRGLHDGPTQAVVQQAQVQVDLGGRPLDEPQRTQERSREAQSADGEVADSAGGRSAVVDLGGHLHLS